MELPNKQLRLYSSSTFHFKVFAKTTRSSHTQVLLISANVTKAHLSVDDSHNVDGFTWLRVKSMGPLTLVHQIDDLRSALRRLAVCLSQQAVPSKHLEVKIPFVMSEIVPVAIWCAVTLILMLIDLWKHDLSSVSDYNIYIIWLTPDSARPSGSCHLGCHLEEDSQSTIPSTMSLLSLCRLQLDSQEWQGNPGTAKVEPHLSS